jgi:hypothetical protein
MPACLPVTRISQKCSATDLRFYTDLSGVVLAKAVSCVRIHVAGMQTREDNGSV